VPNAGLLPAAVLAERLDVAGLVDRRLRLARHGANSGAKALSVVGSILAGGDSIDDIAVLRAGAAGSLFDGTRAHKWSNVRQLDAVSRELLVRLWAASAGGADLASPLTIDLGSTIVEVHGGPSRARHSYTPARPARGRRRRGHRAPRRRLTRLTVSVNSDAAARSERVASCG